MARIERIGIDTMGLLLQIVHDRAGSWTVHGLPTRPIAQLASLSEGIAYARRECAEAPATIELLIGDFYAVIHQEQGWPREVLSPGIEQPSLELLGAQVKDRPISIRFRDWFRRWG